MVATTPPYVMKAPEQVTVELSYRYDWLLGLQESEGEFTSKVIVAMSWDEPQLANLTQPTTFPTNELRPTAIWTPPLVIYETSTMHRLSAGPVSVLPGGRATWQRIGVVTSVCDFNFERFPYDRFVCYHSFAVLNMNQNHLRLVHVLRPNKPLLSHGYVPSGKWKLTKIEAVTTEIQLFFDTTNFTDVVRVSLHWQRNSGVHSALLVVPFMMLNALIPCGYFMTDPSNYFISLMLSMTFYMGLILSSLPFGNTIPTFGKFVVATYCWCAVNTVTSILRKMMTTSHPKAGRIVQYVMQGSSVLYNILFFSLMVSLSRFD